MTIIDNESVPRTAAPDPERPDRKEPRRRVWLLPLVAIVASLTGAAAVAALTGSQAEEISVPTTTTSPHESNGAAGGLQVAAAYESGLASALSGARTAFTEGDDSQSWDEISLTLAAFANVVDRLDPPAGMATDHARVVENAKALLGRTKDAANCPVFSTSECAGSRAALKITFSNDTIQLFDEAYALLAKAG